jgi:hypothetical protein
LDFEVCHQDLESNFALKIHAMLCRPYLKGRDWFDFSWYVKNQIHPNLPHLQAALLQWGPWKNQELKVDIKWLKSKLTEKILKINWQDAAIDVERFLSVQEQHSLKLWSVKFFIHKTDMMN